MVAYSFKARFAEPITEGVKGGTIRAPRRAYYHPDLGGHAAPGKPLHLYTGMRTKQCRLITRLYCIATETINLDFVVGRIAIGGRLWLSDDDDLDRLAVFDGFTDFGEMRDFWKGTDYFDGWHIRWLELPKFTIEEGY